MMMHKITPLCRLQLVVEMFGHSTNHNSIKVPKLVKRMNKKTEIKKNIQPNVSSISVYKMETHSHNSFLKHGVVNNA